MKKEIVILPGIGGSGDAHWQTRWEQADSSMHRFRPDDWDQPTLGDWYDALERSVKAMPAPPLLVAHSLSCLLIAHWQSRSALPVAGALLVAVPDPASAVFPPEAASFASAPRTRFRFPSLIIASNNDPYAAPEYSRATANQWGSGLVEAGALGHINGASELGDWPEGLRLLAAFRAGLGTV